MVLKSRWEYVDVDIFAAQRSFLFLVLSADAASGGAITFSPQGSLLFYSSLC